MKFSLILFSALTTVNAFNKYGPMIQQETDVPSMSHQGSRTGWVLSEDAKAGEKLKVHFHFQQTPEQLQELEDTLMAVSDPTSPNYGHHLNNLELAQIVGASEESINLVREWLRENGIEETVLHQSRDVLTLETSVAVLENLLSADIVAYSHPEVEGSRLLRAIDGYHLPSQIDDVVALVSDLSRLPPVKRHLKPVPFSSQVTYTTPKVLADRYKITPSSEVKSNSFGVYENLEQFWDPTSVATFKKEFGIDTAPSKTIGLNTPSKPGTEALLDIEYIKAVAPEIPLTFYYTTDWILEWVTALNNLSPIVYVWSISYGSDEAATGTTYVQQSNVQLQKAGVKGISLFVSSGDSGAAGSGSSIFKSKFAPDFPSGSPYITAVGGTDFLSAVGGEETTWNLGGGGFSEVFTTASYQTSEVAKYLKTATLPAASKFNSKGRGYPDVSALGGPKNPYEVAIKTQFGGVYGTSASGPVVAGIFAKLNGIRLAKGKSPLGFVNPFIYQHPEAFNDVTTGNNGFAAIVGWDPATGLGTPNYTKLAQIVEALP